MASLRDITLGELARALARYRPVAVTVLIILVALALIPKPDVAETQATGFDQGADSTTTTVTTALDGGAGTTVPVADSSGSFPSSTPSFSSPSSDPSFPSSATSPGASEPGSFGATDEPTNTTTGGDPPIDPRLRIVGKAWASRTGGTPIGADGVPAGSLPVGTRLGQDDKLSFVRLEGTDEVLRLAENPAGTRDVSGPASVRACQVTEANWVEAEAITIEEGPDYDASVCVEGVRSEDGVWSFDLVTFPSPTDARGIALVPGEGAGIDFQVAFQSA